MNKKPMNSAEAMGHIAVWTTCIALVFFLGLGGLLVGIVIFLAWVILTNKEEK